MENLLLLAFAIALTFGGLALMVYGLLSVRKDNYIPKHTRSTYRKPKK